MQTTSVQTMTAGRGETEEVGATEINSQIQLLPPSPPSFII